MPKQNWERDLLDMARSYCERVALEKSSKHIRVQMTGPNGEKRYVVCSTTPGDYRSLANTAKTMKKVAAEIGAYR